MFNKEESRARSESRRNEKLVRYLCEIARVLQVLPKHADVMAEIYAMIARADVQQRRIAELEKQLKNNEATAAETPLSPADLQLRALVDTLSSRVNALEQNPATDAAIREIQAQGCEMFIEFNRKLAKDYPTAMVAKALEVTELNGEQFAARIRAGEVQP